MQAGRSGVWRAHVRVPEAAVQVEDDQLGEGGRERGAWADAHGGGGGSPPCGQRGSEREAKREEEALQRGHVT